MSIQARQKDAKAKAKLAQTAPELAHLIAEQQNLSQTNQEFAVSAALQLNPSPPSVE